MTAVLLIIVLLTGCANIGYVHGKNRMTETESLEETEISSLSFSEMDAEDIKSLPKEKNVEIKNRENADEIIQTQLANITAIELDTETDTITEETVLAESIQSETISNEWANLYSGADDLIMDGEEIEAWNQAQMTVEQSGIRNLWGIDNLVSGDEVRSKINGYEFPDKQYIDGEKVTASRRENIMANRNLSALSGEIEVRYGIITSNADVRSFPTQSVIRDETDARGFDYFQESMSSVGEAVLIYHTSLDGEWYFVDTKTYCGWISRYNVGLCEFEEAKSFVEAKPFVTLLNEMKLNEKYLRMGTTFPLEKANADNYTIKFPYRDEDGGLYLKSFNVEKSDEICQGYLPYTVTNVTNQALKLQGISYGWGDKDGSLDCSSTMMNIYKCFGIILPRNTSAQMYIQGANFNVENYSDEEKMTLLAQVMPGSLLIFQGHVMMYLGQKNETRYILHNVTQYSTDNSNVIDAYKCVITPLSLYRLNGKSYISELRHIIEIM